MVEYLEFFLREWVIQSIQRCYGSWLMPMRDNLHNIATMAELTVGDAEEATCCLLTWYQAHPLIQITGVHITLTYPIKKSTNFKCSSESTKTRSKAVDRNTSEGHTHTHTMYSSHFKQVFIVLISNGRPCCFEMLSRGGRASAVAVGASGPPPRIEMRHGITGIALFRTLPFICCN